MSFSIYAARGFLDDVDNIMMIMYFNNMGTTTTTSWSTKEPVVVGRLWGCAEWSFFWSLVGEVWDGADLISDF
jgi:hypothetical protein